MSERWINNNSGYANSSTTSSFAIADLMKVAAKITKPEPIMAFRGTAAQLARAIPESPLPPFLGPVVMADPLHGLDVVEEDGWVYIGTTTQLAEARKRWGSLTEARRGADLFKTPVRYDGIGSLFA